MREFYRMNVEDIEYEKRFQKNMMECMFTPILVMLAGTYSTFTTSGLLFWVWLVLTCCNAVLVAFCFRKWRQSRREVRDGGFWIERKG